MDEPTNHLDLASAEALAESLESYDGTLIFVSHNRAFVRRLATRIWSVADGTVETYPGTLDEYMDTCRKRQELEDAAGSNGSKAKPAPQPVKNQPVKSQPEPSRASTAAAPSKNANAGNAAAPPRAAAKPVQEQAQAKKSKNRAQKLERESRDLEAKIAELETAQKQRSDLLADPGVYADKQQSSKLLQEFREVQPELERLMARWEEVQLELDGAGSTDTADAN
jgi:ATP-binding cassette subfamily F protein 3